MTKRQPPFQVVAEIIKIETRRKGIRVEIDTNELAPGDAATLMSYINAQGWFLFAPQELQQSDIDGLPDIPKEEDEQKSPSQRLRGVLFVLWQQSKSRANGQTFEVYYRSYMEKLIDAIKEKLP